MYIFEFSDGIFKTCATYSKKKSFHLIEESLCTFYELKKSKMQVATQYLVKILL